MTWLWFTYRTADRLTALVVTTRMQIVASVLHTKPLQHNQTGCMSAATWCTSVKSTRQPYPEEAAWAPVLHLSCPAGVVSRSQRWFVWTPSPPHSGNKPSWSLKSSPHELKARPARGTHWSQINQFLSRNKLRPAHRWIILLPGRAFCWL